MELTLSMTGTAKTIVADHNTAHALGSGELPVFATPAMIALMEQAAYTTIGPALEKGQGSVGIEINVTHEAASAIGKEIIAHATVTAIEGRIITFALEAYEGITLIGKGTHKRCIINNEKFMSKLI